MKLKRKKVEPISLSDVTIIDDAKLRKAITAASLGNAMEWFDFGVYGFVAYALGKVFFPDANPRHNHCDYVRQYILYRAYSLVCVDRYLGACPAVTL